MGYHRKEVMKPSIYTSVGQKRRRCWTEDQLSLKFPSSAFDFRKPKQGRQDDHDVLANLPCRILDNWKLKRQSVGKQHTFRSCVSLPTETECLEGYTLSGTLKPIHTHQNPVSITLTNLEYYIIEKSKGFRGYWVITPTARYWLHKPCSKRVEIPRLKIRLGGEIMEQEKQGDDDTLGASKCRHLEQIGLPSQEQLHCYHRAVLGLLSNLIDIFMPNNDASFANMLTQSTPKELYVLLSPSAEIIDFYNLHAKSDTAAGDDVLHQHPFDLNLLASSFQSLQRHLVSIHPNMKKSKFFRAAKLTSRKEKSRDGIATLTASAEAAEKRSKQYPWGESRVEGDGEFPSINLALPLEVELMFYGQNQTIHDAPKIQPTEPPAAGVGFSVSSTSKASSNHQEVETGADSGEFLCNRKPSVSTIQPHQNVSRCTSIVSVDEKPSPEESKQSGRTATDALPYRFDRVEPSSPEPSPEFSPEASPEKCRNVKSAVAHCSTSGDLSGAQQRAPSVTIAETDAHPQPNGATHQVQGLLSQAKVSKMSVPRKRAAKQLPKTTDAKSADAKKEKLTLSSLIPRKRRKASEQTKTSKSQEKGETSPKNRSASKKATRSSSRLKNPSTSETDVTSAENDPVSPSAEEHDQLYDRQQNQENLTDNDDTGPSQQANDADLNAKESSPRNESSGRHDSPPRDEPRNRAESPARDPSPPRNEPPSRNESPGRNESYSRDRSPDRDNSAAPDRSPVPGLPYDLDSAPRRDEPNNRYDSPKRYDSPGRPQSPRRYGSPNRYDSSSRNDGFDRYGSPGRNEPSSRYEPSGRYDSPNRYEPSDRYKSSGRASGNHSGNNRSPTYSPRSSPRRDMKYEDSSRPYASSSRGFAAPSRSPPTDHFDSNNVDSYKYRDDGLSPRSSGPVNSRRAPDNRYDRWPSDSSPPRTSNGDGNRRFEKEPPAADKVAPSRTGRMWNDESRQKMIDRRLELKRLRGEDLGSMEDWRVQPDDVPDDNPGQNEPVNSGAADRQTMHEAKTVCAFFTTIRGCRNGANCRFLHTSKPRDEVETDNDRLAGDTRPRLDGFEPGRKQQLSLHSSSSAAPERQVRPIGKNICAFFLTDRGCRNGDNCRFLHTTKSELSLNTDRSETQDRSRGMSMYPSDSRPYRESSLSGRTNEYDQYRRSRQEPDRSEQGLRSFQQDPMEENWRRRRPESPRRYSSDRNDAYDDEWSPGKRRRYDMQDRHDGESDRKYRREKYDSHIGGVSDRMLPGRDSRDSNRDGFRPDYYDEPSRFRERESSDGPRPAQSDRRTFRPVDSRRSPSPRGAYGEIRRQGDREWKADDRSTSENSAMLDPHYDESSQRQESRDQRYKDGPLRDEKQRKNAGEDNIADSRHAGIQEHSVVSNESWEMNALDRDGRHGARGPKDREPSFNRRYRGQFNDNRGRSDPGRPQFRNDRNNRTDEVSRYSEQKSKQYRAEAGMSHRGGERYENDDNRISRPRDNTCSLESANEDWRSKERFEEASPPRNAGPRQGYIPRGHPRFEPRPSRVQY